jgi:ubiquinone/menaquinone biosynthesis C-methylase UbiE
MTATDIWHRWLLERRSGGNSKLAELHTRQLAAVRDRVLKYASIRAGDTFLDVGSGDGLIAFGALDLVGETGRVIFSDISQPLLDHTRALATEAGLLDPCEFVQASADDLSSMPDASVDVVTTRSVLIYVKDKQRSFAEFYRVLRPGGRLSIFEPINRIDLDPRYFSRLWGLDMAPVQELCDRLRAIYYPDGHEDDPMLDFDERDLVRMAEDAGFPFVSLRLDYDYAAHVVDTAAIPPFEVLVNAAPNPNAPSLAEAMDRVLSREERERFVAHVRPLVERGERFSRSAVAYLRARKE